MPDDHAIPAWVSAGILAILIALSVKTCTATIPAPPEPPPTTDTAADCWPAEDDCHA